MNSGRRGERASALWGSGGRNGDSRKRGWLKALPLAVVAALLLAPGAAAAKRPAAGVLPDVLPPETSLTAGPADGATVTSATTTFAYSASERASFECSADRGAFERCSSSFKLRATPGEHTFAVRAVDRAGNVDPTPAQVSFTYLPYVSTASYPAGSLLGRAQQDPLRVFPVIVETEHNRFLGALRTFTDERGKHKRTFKSIDGLAAKLPGYAILFLHEDSRVAGKVTITDDRVVKLSDVTLPELWAAAAKTKSVADDVAAAGLETPAIAIVDSGVEASRVAEFGGRVVESVSMIAEEPENVDDDNGHGTFVASVAAGANGAAPTTDIVSVRVMNAAGAIRTSDVIAAADWILANKNRLKIGVANFSLHAANQGSFKFDPLDHAVEKLWFNGVTVVAAAGNFGDGTAKHMVYAPGNDPFVITVGATDVMGTEHPEDDIVPSWSAFGYTADGFAKPEVVAPGRYFVAAVPEGSQLALERPDKVVSPGYMKLSGTSFSAPVVAGAAAHLMALNPTWGPDQVKGALMVTSHGLPAAADPRADGMGTINVALAAKVLTPPNPNAALNRFVVNGDFDEAAWTAAANADVSWADVSWADVSWADVSWRDVSWADVSWADVSWADVSWADVSWADVSWADVSWADVSWADVSWADVSWADVSWADVSFASVSWADVSWADAAFGDVSWADVSWADVSWAD